MKRFPLAKLLLAISLMPVVFVPVTEAAAKRVRHPVKADPAPDPVTVPVAAPHEQRIVRYTYSPDLIYRIYTHPMRHTHIALGDDEGLKETPVVGDSIQWRITGGPTNLYVKPVRDDIETSLTLITNKRTYQFQLIASGKNKTLYQKVSFDYPDREAQIRLMQDQAMVRVQAENARLGSQVLSSSIHPDELDFNFSVKGNASFAPTSVYTDGTFTYLRMPSTQDTPAVFLVDDEGAISLINFRTKPNLIIVERVAKKLLLKLGTKEVTVRYNGTKG